MRTYPDEARRSRTLADIIADALALLHQDIAEYGFTGLIGAIGAAFLALILSTTGGLAGKALIAPAVFIVALVTYANTCAAIRRVQYNLEPDAVRAFFAVLARLPALILPLAPPIALSGTSVLSGVIAARWAPDSVVTLAVVIVFALCGLSSFQRSLYVPALFARNASVADARSMGGSALRSTSALTGACFVITLAPAAIMALAALSIGFGPLSTAAAAFMLVACMPFAAAVASLIYDGVAPRTAKAAAPGPGMNSRQRNVSASPPADRLTRYIR